MKIKTRSESEMSRIKLAKAWLNFNDGETAKLKIKILIKLININNFYLKSSVKSQQFNLIFALKKVIEKLLLRFTTKA